MWGLAVLSWFYQVKLNKGTMWWKCRNYPHMLSFNSLLYMGPIEAVCFCNLVIKFKSDNSNQKVDKREGRHQARNKYSLLLCSTLALCKEKNQGVLFIYCLHNFAEIKLFLEEFQNDTNPSKLLHLLYAYCTFINCWIKKSQLIYSLKTSMITN